MACNSVCVIFFSNDIESNLETRQHKGDQISCLKYIKVQAKIKAKSCNKNNNSKKIKTKTIKKTYPSVQ